MEEGVDQAPYNPNPPQSLGEEKLNFAGGAIFGFGKNSVDWVW